MTISERILMDIGHVLQITQELYGCFEENRKSGGNADLGI